MSLLKIFTRKKADSSVTELLRKDEVRTVTHNFMDNYLLETDGVIIIWASQGYLYYDAGGIDTEAEALGILSLCDAMIKKRGLPYK